MYHIGYGIISQQGKEAKHSAVKNDLKLSNRPNRTDKLCIFLNINHYHWHTSPTLSQEYVPPHCVPRDVSNSGRNKQLDGNVSHTCLQSQDIVKRAQQQKLSSQLVEIFKPYVCFNLECGQRVPDNLGLQLHDLLHNGREAVSWSAKNPNKMTVVELKVELRKRNLSIGGKKNILIRRLGGSLLSWLISVHHYII